METKVLNIIIARCKREVYKVNLFINFVCFTSNSVAGGLLLCWGGGAADPVVRSGDTTLYRHHYRNKRGVFILILFTVINTIASLNLIFSDTVKPLSILPTCIVS